MKIGLQQNGFLFCLNIPIFAYKKINDSLKKLKHFFESLMGEKKRKALP